MERNNFKDELQLDAFAFKSIHVSARMLQALVYISALSKSHFTNAVQILNFLGRAIPKHKRKFDKTERKKVTVWGKSQFLLTLQSNR